jgi:hypothetical protein
MHADIPENPLRPTRWVQEASLVRPLSIEALIESEV